MAKAEKEKEAKSLEYKNLAAHILYSNGEESFEEFINVAQMLYYIKKLFFEKSSHLDKVKIEMIQNNRH